MTRRRRDGIRGSFETRTCAGCGPGGCAGIESEWSPTRRRAITMHKAATTTLRRPRRGAIASKAATVRALRRALWECEALDIGAALAPRRAAADGIAGAGPGSKTISSVGDLGVRCFRVRRFGETAEPA